MTNCFIARASIFADANVDHWIVLGADNSNATTVFLSFLFFLHDVLQLLSGMFYYFI